jgi:hypothetical protein
MSTEIIVAFITGVMGVVGPLSILYAKNKLSKSKKPDMVKETLKISQLVTSKIEDLRDELHCDRVWISQFHNGGNFYPTGKSMAKFSIIYEVVGTNTHSKQTNFQNIPVNLFSKSINHLLEKDIIEISDFKDETIATHGLKYLAEETGCKSQYSFAIKTIDNKFIGVLGVDYTKRKTKLDSETINHLLVYAGTLGGVLMNHLKQ